MPNKAKQALKKADLRKTCLHQQSLIPLLQLQKAGQQAAKSLIQWAATSALLDLPTDFLTKHASELPAPAKEAAPLIAAFASLPTEIQTDPLIAHLQKLGCRVILPAIVDGELEFRLLQTPLDALQKGAFGVRTPKEEAPVFSLAEAAFIVVPGLAFDLNGGRLGFGKGYYDRALQKMQQKCAPQKRKPPATLAFALDSQLHSAIPMAEHDVFLSHLCTPEKGVFAANIQ